MALLGGHGRGEELRVVSDVHLTGVGAVADPEREHVAGEDLVDLAAVLGRVRRCDSVGIHLGHPRCRGDPIDEVRGSTGTSIGHVQVGRAVAGHPARKADGAADTHRSAQRARRTGHPGRVCDPRHAAETADLADEQVVANHRERVDPQAVAGATDLRLARRRGRAGHIVDVENADDVTRLDEADQQVLLTGGKSSRPTVAGTGHQVGAGLGDRRRNRGTRVGHQRQRHRAPTRHAATFWVLFCTLKIVLAPRVPEATLNTIRATLMLFEAASAT